MGLFGDLKKILFGAKAITKSAAGKVAEAGKDVGGDLLDKSGDVLSKAKDVAGDVGGSAMDLSLIHI